MNKIEDTIIDRALREDIGSQDVTTNLLVPQKSRAKAFIVVKQNATLCGLGIAKKVFQKLDRQMEFHSRFKDGDRVKKNTRIISLEGKTRALLTAERTALNFLSHLSGIATKTDSLLEKILGTKVRILDTRKTTPGLRSLEKKAVGCGGGTNHRQDLSEMIFIKDNHRAFINSSDWLQLIASIRKRSHKKIEVEVDNLAQFKAALKARPDIILLDNMSPRSIKKAVSLARKLPANKRPKLEASGGINSKNIVSFARTGVDFISIGELTHSVQAIDMSLEIEG